MVSTLLLRIAYPVIGGTASGCLRWYVIRALFTFNIHSGIPQVDARVSIFRGEVRSVAGGAITSYGITDVAQADEYLLPGLTYIYPVDPVVSTPFPLVSALAHSFHRLRSYKRTNRTATPPSRQPFVLLSSIVGMAKIFSRFANHPSLGWRSLKFLSPWSRCLLQR